jgi:general secretion pathway protein F
MTMPLSDGVSYRYSAARLDGTIERGDVSAPSRDGALAALSDRGLFPVEIVARSPVRVRRARVAAADLALGLRMLASLLEAGLPISRALAAFGDLAPAAWRVGLSSLRDSVREGQTLGAALARSPLEIPSLVIGIVRAGEAGSGLAAAVRSAADLTEHVAATRAAIRAALTYPVILAVAGVASIGLLIGVVLPRFALILADLGQALPPSTRFVLGAASFARDAALPVIAGFLLLFIAWRSWTAGERGRENWHGILLKVPGIGDVRQSAATSRVSLALSALLRSGVPIPGALQHAARAAGDAYIEARLLAAREQVIGGARIARALADLGALTPTAVRLVGAGEETGRLAELLDHAARIERERAQDLTRAGVRLLEPATVLVFGAIVALVAAALLQAVYSVRPGA